MRQMKLMVALVSLNMFVGYNAAFADDCSAAKQVQISDKQNALVVDNVWSGTAVAFDAVSRNGKVYIGYYDSDRKLSVAQVDLTTKAVCRKHLDSIFRGWDGHNSIILDFDQAGRLQIAGNMHATPLVYGSSTAPDSLAGLALHPMTGRNERSVTYPVFLNSQSGKKLFIYRDGMSGNGTWVINALNGDRWERLNDGPLFASSYNGAPTSAYPSKFELDADGNINLAIVWRKTIDIASNYALTYARSRDFVHWTNHQGKPIRLPITPDSSDMVDNTGQNHGLINNQRIGVTKDGNPLIVYSKYSADGTNDVILAKPDGASWKQSVIATSSRPTAIKGGGSIPGLPGFSAPTVADNGIGYVDISFPGEPKKRINFDPATLEKTAQIPEQLAKALPSTPRSPTPDLSKLAPDGLVDTKQIALHVRPEDSSANNRSVGSIVYFAQDIHQDRPRKCTPAQPLACNPPPSPLLFVPAVQ